VRLAFVAGLSLLAACTANPANTACSAQLRLDQNVVQLRFAEPGRAHVRIVGLARPGDHPFVLERDLQVTPLVECVPSLSTTLA